MKDARWLLHVIVFALIGTLFSCKTTQKIMPANDVPNVESEDELDQLATLMTGHFSSHAQSVADSSFYDIHLHMYPIWENDKSAKWLYVEQAAATNLDKPYRQRVYQIKNDESGLIASIVYELDDPENYIHAWTKPSIFDKLSPNQLKLREGCAVYLQKTSTGCYKGTTKDNNCTSSLRGASYASSRVQICQRKIVSWDQGWDNNGMQVWGAEKSGYIFDRIAK